MPLQIFVRSGTVGVHALEVRETDTVAQVRRQVGESDNGYPEWKVWRVMQGDRELAKDEQTLGFYKIQDGMILHLKVRVFIKVSVHTPPCGRLMVIDDCEPHDRIIDCKRKLFEHARKWGARELPLPTRQSLLLPNGEELVDLTTFEEYGIAKEAVFNMGERSERPLRMSVKTEDGRAFLLEMDEWDCVADLRDRLTERDEKHPEDALAKIMYANEELDDDDVCLGSYGIQQSGMLFLNMSRLLEQLSVRAPPVEMVPQPSIFFLQDKQEEVPEPEDATPDQTPKTAAYSQET